MRLFAHHRRLVAAWVCTCLSLSSAAQAQAQDADELGRLSDALVQSHAEHDVKNFLALFDLETFTDRAVSRIPPDLRPSARREIRGSVGEVIGALVTNLPEGTAMTFLHDRVVDQKTRLTYRVLGPQGLNYWECEVEKVNGSLKVVDIHIAMTGEPITLTLQTLLLRSMPANGKDLTEAEGKILSDVQKFTRIARTGDAKEALRLYDALPEKFKKDKAIQLARVLAATKLDDATLTAVGTDFKNRFGDDPACDLVLVDTYIARQDIDNIRGCLERLDKSVGGDPYLDVLMGNALLGMGRLDDAKLAVAKALDRDPLQFDAYDTLLQIAAQEKDFPGMKRVLLKMETEPAWAFRFDDDFNNAEMFEPFKQSPQYKEWLAERPKLE